MSDYPSCRMEIIKPAVAVYVHIPFCQRKCPYCGFYSEPVAGQPVRRVLQAMLLELRQYDSICAGTLYIGGGSPSSLSIEDFAWFVQELTGQVGKGREFTVEVNPGQVDPGKLEKMANLGINRLSIGAQSFQQRELDFLQRAYSAGDITDSVNWARTAGFRNISLDLMFAIPGSTRTTWQANLDKAIGLDVEHISAYSLTYEENTPLFARLRRGDVQSVGEETDREMYETAIDVLGGAGYEQYEISNFARPGYRCSHNLAYWSNMPYIGIGPGASSWWQGMRSKNREDIAGYISALEQGEGVHIEEEKPSRKQIACETAILMLRRTSGINLGEYYCLTGYDAMELFAETIRKYHRMDLLQVDDDGIRLTRNALPISDSILCDFAG